jgi:predicted phage tail protein
MKEIRLYGEAGQKFGRVHRFAVKTAAEALRALKANCAGFESYMCKAHERGVGFKMFVGASSIKDYPEIHYPAGRAQVIRLVPVFAGSKNGFLQILTGIILIAGAIVAAPFTAGSSLSFIPNALGALGASMIIGGVATLLTSPPDGPQVDKSSFVFQGPVNTSLQGKAVPVGYGRLVVGSAVISAGIETYEVPV